MIAENDERACYARAEIADHAVHKSIEFLCVEFTHCRAPCVASSARLEGQAHVADRGDATTHLFFVNEKRT
jgi:hypothetical protein